MNQSGTIAALSKSLVAAQKEIGHAVKENTNPAFRSKYADITSVINAVRPVFAAHGLALIQGIEPHPTDTNQLCVVTRLLHESGEWLESCLAVPLPQGKGAQGTGMSATYGRRYGAAAMCFLGQEDDDGNEASGVAPKTTPKPALSKPAETPVNPEPVATPAAGANQEPAKKGPGRPKKVTEPAPDMEALKAQFAAAKTKDDITKLIPLFTRLTSDQQTEILPIATAARERAGL